MYIYQNPFQKPFERLHERENVASKDIPPKGPSSSLNNFESYEPEIALHDFLGKFHSNVSSAPSDPWSNISTGLPGNMGELVKDLDPKTLNRAVVGTILALKGFHYVKTGVEAAYRTIKPYLKRPYLKTPQNSETPTDVSNPNVFANYNTLRQLNSDLDQQDETTSPPPWRTFYGSGFLTDLLQEYVDANLPGSFDENATILISDIEAKALNIMGKMAVPNELLSRIRHLPKDKFSKLTDFVSKYDREPNETTFRSFDHDSTMEKLADIYNKQKLGSFEETDGSESRYDPFIES